VCLTNTGAVEQHVSGNAGTIIQIVSDTTGAVEQEVPSNAGTTEKVVSVYAGDMLNFTLTPV